MAIADQHKIAATGSVTPTLLQRPRGATAEMAVTIGDAFADVFRLMAQATPRPTESSGGHAGEVPWSTDGRQESSPTEEADAPERDPAADASAPRSLAQAVPTDIAPAAIAVAAETAAQSADAPELQTPIDAAQPSQPPPHPQRTAAHSPEATPTDGQVAAQPVTAAAIENPLPLDPAQGPVAVPTHGPATDAASQAAGGIGLPGQDQQQPTGVNRDQPVLSEQPSATPRTVTGEGNVAPAAQASEQRTAPQPQAGADGGDSGGQDHRSRRSERSGRRREARSEPGADPQRSPSPRADASAPAEIRPPLGSTESAVVEAMPAADAAQPARAAAAPGGLIGATAAAAGSAAAKAASAAPAATASDAASGADATTSPAVTGSKPAAASGSRLASGGDEASGTSVADRARLVQRVSKAFQRMGQDGGRIRIRLHPAELGSVRLEMQVQGKEVRARVVVETEAARGLLREHLHELRSRLADQGMHVQHLDVELGDATQGGAEQGSQQSSLGYPSPDERREAARLARSARRGIEPPSRDGGASEVRRRGTTAARIGGVDLMV